MSYESPNIWHPEVPESVHDCVGTLQGDWVVYTCPLCDYEVRDNARTGEFEVINAKLDVRHRGRYSGAQNVN